MMPGDKPKIATESSLLSLKDIIDLKEWQKIQDNFSAVTNISIRTVGPEGKSLTSPSGEPRLCSELLKVCGICLPSFLGGKATVDKNLSFICNFGLHHFLAPLKLTNSKVLGYIILGPVILVMRKEKEEYQQVEKELNIKLEDFWNALLDIRVISFQGMQSVVELITGIAEYTLKLAYKNIVKAKEMVMAGDPAKLNRLLDVLLSAAFEISGADIGSVMFVDDKKEKLTIRASRGIPDEIANRAQVRLGEGISGIAAEEGKSFLIDDALKDRKIRSYLKRPYLSSSMVLPIKVEKDVLGVMNLGTLKTSAVRFNLDNVRLMNRLIDLASVAISPAK
jgi:ligand-binding sensor protein